MEGDLTDADLWDGDPSWYAEEIIRARLNVLDRQNRIEEYLNLAEAADLIDAYVTMLVEEGRIDEAIEYAKNRKPFGKALATNQGIQFPLVELHSEAERLCRCTQAPTTSPPGGGTNDRADRLRL